MGKQKVLSPREQAMQELLQRHKEDQAAVRADNPDESLPGEEEILESDLDNAEITDNNDDNDDELIEAISDDGEEATENVEDEPEEEMIEIKVQGQIKSIPKSKAIQILQKNENADKKTQEAVIARKKAEEIQQLYEQKLKELESAPPSTRKGDDSGIAQTDSKRIIREALEKVYDGDIDNAADVLAGIVGAKENTSNSLTTADIERTVAKLQEQDRQTRELNQAWSNFSNNERYAALVNEVESPLFNMVDQLTLEVQRDPEFMASKPSYEQIFAEAGERALRYISGVNGVTERAPDPVDERTNQKRSIARPQSRTIRRGPAPEAQPKTREDILADMARARGQNTLN